MTSKLWFSTQYRVFRLSNEPKKKGRTQTTKVPTVEVSAINPTSGFRLTSTRPRAPPIIISLSDLTISCSSMTNSNHHEIRAPPWQAATTTWWEWGWGWVVEWMRVRVRVTGWDHKGRMRVRVRWERWLTWEKMRVNLRQIHFKPNNNGHKTLNPNKLAPFTLFFLSFFLFFFLF